MTENNKNINFWGELPLEAEQYWQIRFSEKELTLGRDNHGILFAKEDKDESDFGKELIAIPETPPTFKHFLTKENQSVKLVPVFPKKALLVKPKLKTALLPKESVEVCVPVPSALNLYTSNEKTPVSLTEISTKKLPDAWFGDEFGEPCFLFETEFIFDEYNSDNLLDTIFCPVSLTNTSEEMLEVDKFILRVGHLHLYQDDSGKLVADQVNIRFRGQSSESLISVSKPNAAKWKNLTLLHPAEVPVVEQLIKKSFDFIRSMY